MLKIIYWGVVFLILLYGHIYQLTTWQIITGIAMYTFIFCLGCFFYIANL